MKTIPPALQHEITEWVNSEFEVAEPTELGQKPRDLDDDPSWQGDPASDLSGTVYLSDETVYYYAPDTPPKSGWWDMGPLPDELREKITNDDSKWRISVEVVSEDGEEMGFARGSLPDFSQRVDELGNSLNTVASSLQAHLSALAKNRTDGWDLDQVTLAFSLSPQAGGGVIIAQASTTAGFQATLNWKRSAG